MKCCDIDFSVLEIKYFPVEALEDYKDPELPVIYCPFCGKKLSTRRYKCAKT